MRRALAGLAVAALGVAQLLLAAGGRADTPTKVGWWNQTQRLPGAAPTIPAPPTSPDGGITVINSPTGPAAWGAVYYPVGDIAGATLTLSSETPIAIPAGDGLLGCLVDTPGWRAGANQRWDTKPVVDPLCTPGVVDAAGTAITFKLSGAFRDADGAVDIAVIPTGQLPFTLNFDAPGINSLTTTPALAPSDVSDDSASAVGEFAAGDVVDGSLLFPDSSGFAFATPPPRPASANPAVKLGGHEPAPRAVAATERPRSERVAVVLIVVGLLFSLWRLAGQTVRAPRLLGSLGGEAAAPVVNDAAPSGIGRFARSRTERPRRLL